TTGPRATPQRVLAPRSPETSSRTAAIFEQAGQGQTCRRGDGDKERHDRQGATSPTCEDPLLRSRWDAIKAAISDWHKHLPGSAAADALESVKDRAAFQAKRRASGTTIRLNRMRCVSSAIAASVTVVSATGIPPGASMWTQIKKSFPIRRFRPLEPAR